MRFSRSHLLELTLLADDSLLGVSFCAIELLYKIYDCLKAAGNIGCNTISTRNGLELFISRDLWSDVSAD